MYQYKTVALKAVTYNALLSLVRYRETMDDVVLKLVVAYAKSNNISNESITYANTESIKRFGDKEK